MVPGRVAAGSPGNGSLARAFPRGRAKPSPGTGGCLPPSSAVGVGARSRPLREWAAPDVRGGSCRLRCVSARSESAGREFLRVTRVGAEGVCTGLNPDVKPEPRGDEKVGHGPYVGSAEVSSLGSVVLDRIPGTMGVCVGSGGGRNCGSQGGGPDRVSTIARCKSPGCYSSAI